VRPKCQPRELLPEVREQLFHELQYEATASRPTLALMAIVALLRDAQLRSDPAALRAFRDALSEHVLKYGRRNFEPPELWFPHDEMVERPGEQIPGVRQIADEYGVSIGTARRATAVLAEEGLVVVTPSWGAFIPE
jgi:hypothetical protein